MMNVVANHEKTNGFSGIGSIICASNKSQHFGIHGFKKGNC
jgi:hypothetical protein